MRDALFDIEKSEQVAGGLSFPTSLAFDAQGTAFVAESGLPFGGAPPGGRIQRINPDGSAVCVRNGLRQPVNGLLFHDGAFIVAEGGYPGRISRMEADGELTTILDNLPGMGNYHTNMAVIGPDGKLYFSQGAMTNSGVVGLDSYTLGWLRCLPPTYDVPGLDITLVGVNYETVNPLEPEAVAPAHTGAFAQFATSTAPGQRIAGRVPCTAAIMRCNLDGSELELVAWGLRNAYGLGFLPDGRLLATDQGADERGSRPVGHAPDMLYEVRTGAWYGWPDFIGGVPITDAGFAPQGGTAPRFVLAKHEELPAPELPRVRFPVNAAAVKFAVAPAGLGAYAGHLFVALFGDEKPMTAPPGPRRGRGIARVDTSDWSLHDALKGPFHRPIDLAFAPDGTALYVLDFGDFEMDNSNRVAARAGSGSLWKVPLIG